MALLLVAAAAAAAARGGGGGGGAAARPSTLEVGAGASGSVPRWATATAQMLPAELR